MAVHYPLLSSTSEKFHQLVRVDDALPEHWQALSQAGIDTSPSVVTARFWTDFRKMVKYRWTETRGVFSKADVDKLVQLLRAMLRLEPKKREKVGTLLEYEIFGKMRQEAATADEVRSDD